MMDPPREGVAEAVQSFRNAHVQTVMITGDHVDTALAIAKELGIAQSHEQCMRGEELELLSQEELIGRVEGIRVFARVSPEHKVRIVHALKAKGKTVAMTGDGINDAPALKRADVGIAMGGIGSDIAVDAADIVLVDDEVKELPHLIALSKRMMITIKCNMSFSMALNFVAIVLAMTGILNPVVGALVHNAGSVLVIINSAWLLKWKFRKSL